MIFIFNILHVTKGNHVQFHGYNILIIASIEWDSTKFYTKTHSKHVL